MIRISFWKPITIPNQSKKLNAYKSNDPMGTRVIVFSLRTLPPH
ncbi:hypothetical protein ADU37_CDS22540 [Thermococcus sp. 2319x1]|nr:hypothetical protein ADU37_CDS22540 [Thermococcus sp. 2319x1]